MGAALARAYIPGEQCKAPSSATAAARSCGCPACVCDARFGGMRHVGKVAAACISASTSLCSSLSVLRPFPSHPPSAHLIFCYSPSHLSASMSLLPLPSPPLCRLGPLSLPLTLLPLPPYTFASSPPVLSPCSFPSLLRFPLPFPHRTRGFTPLAMCRRGIKYE